jgi:lysophospholipase L1-like esterase
VGNGDRNMQSRIYQHARRWLRAAVWGACVAGCSSVGEGPADQPGGAPGASGLGAGGATAQGGSSAGGLSANSGGAAVAGAASGAGSANAGGTSGLANAGGAANPGGALNSGGGASAGSTAGTSNAGTAGTAGIGASAGAAGAANLPAVSVYIAGDSTVSEYTLDPQNPKSQAGWGQMLSANYTTKVKVLDKAVGGRTARRFIQEGSLAAILKLLQPGDYLLVQFGTNDSNTTAKYTLDGVEYPYLAAADSDFKTYLQQYIDGALEKKAIPVLVTPPPRNSAYCKGPRSLGNYGQAMLDLGKADSVAVVDLGLETHAHLSAICPKPSSAAQEMFFKVNADDSIDGTHFQENGARIMAGFVADGIDEAKLGLSAYRKR